MRPGAIKVETKGSFFWLDEAAGEYLRLPKEERPRERPEWSDERAGALQDAVWHPMVGWRIGPFPLVQPDFEKYLEQYGDPFLAAAAFRAHERSVDATGGLLIDTPEGQTTWAPEARVVA